MKIIVRNLVKEDEKYKYFKNLKICVMSDIHLGSPNLNKKLLKETIEYIKNNDDVFTILNGDLIDMTLKTSIGDVYQNTMSPMEQVESLIELIQPIKDKILVVACGNHERRTIKETNIDVLKLVCNQLGIADRYTDGAYYLYLYFGEKEQGRKAPMVYTVSGNHGYGGGRNIGGKANRLVDMSNVAVADLYIMSHTHTPVSTKKSIYIPDYSNKSVTLREMHFLMTNSFLDYENSYGEIQGYHPTSNSRCEAVLDGTKRKIKVII